MPDTLDPALEAALDPKGLQAAETAFENFDGSYIATGDFTRPLAKAIFAYLAAAAPQAEIDRLREALRDEESTSEAMERARILRDRGYVLLAASERLEQEAYDRAVKRGEHTGTDGI